MLHMTKLNMVLADRAEISSSACPVGQLQDGDREFRHEFRHACAPYDKILEFVVREGMIAGTCASVTTLLSTSYSIGVLWWRVC